MQDISVIILTLNEERHIARVMQNALKFARTVYVVDSFSTDRTVELATQMGAVAVRHEFQSHAKQFQWALDNLPITTEWVLRLDADEYLTDKLIDEIERRLPATPSGVNGYTLRCLYNFMGREINHGIIPLVLLRLFRYGKARIEDKLMDEHIYLTEGTTADMTYPFYNASLMTLTEWTAKHNWYATREAIELLTIECQKHSPNRFLILAPIQPVCVPRNSNTPDSHCSGVLLPCLFIVISSDWVSSMARRDFSGIFCKDGGIVLLPMPKSMRSRSVAVMTPKPLRKKSSAYPYPS